MLLPTCLNLTVSLLLFSLHSFYVLHFSSSSFEWGYQSADTKLVKVCAADSINTVPFHYKTAKELDFYLMFPTAMDMSSRFTIVIYLGLTINGLLTLFYLYYSLQTSKQRMKTMGSNVRYYSFLSLCWFLHLYFLVYWRLWLK